MKSQNTALAGSTFALRPLTLFALILLAGGHPPFALAQNDCKVVFDAGDKLTATPHHAYVIQSMQISGGKPDTIEEISVGGIIYVQIHGKWKKSPMTVQQRQQQEQENLKNAKNFSCHHLRDEAVNGESAAVYSAHSETEDIKSDSLIWISRSGLILRQEEDMDSGGDKSHVSVRYEYKNISAPSVSP